MEPGSQVQGGEKFTFRSSDNINAIVDGFRDVVIWFTNFIQVPVVDHDSSRALQVSLTGPPDCTLAT